MYRGRPARTWPPSREKNATFSSPGIWPARSLLSSTRKTSPLGMRAKRLSAHSFGYFAFNSSISFQT